jgi:electron transfer flavoprotein alpha/beta subunit
MKKKLLLLVGVSTLILASAPIAGQPLSLSDAQMDRVAAGAVGSATGLADALGNLEAQTVTLTLGSADSAQGNALAMGLSAASASSLLAPAVARSRSAAIARAP